MLAVIVIKILILKFGQSEPQPETDLELGVWPSGVHETSVK